MPNKSIIVIGHDGAESTYAKGEKWTVDGGCLHVLAGSGSSTRTVATHAAGTWLSVSES